MLSSSAITSHICLTQSPSLDSVTNPEIGDTEIYNLSLASERTGALCIGSFLGDMIVPEHHHTCIAGAEGTLIFDCPVNASVSDLQCIRMLHYASDILRLFPNIGTCSDPVF